VRIVAVAIAVGATLGAFGSIAQAQTADQDSATGDVITVFFRPIGATFDAHSGPSGETPSGSAITFDRTDDFGGPVTCLNVTGNRATIGFENQRQLTDVVKGGFLFVEDNGTPGVGLDNVSHQLLFDAAPTVCPPNTVVYEPGEDGDSVKQGEVTVHDAAPLPASKEQCKRGGWRSFGIFQNQGACVSFVAHHR
jgi:hypothetical protein